MFEANLPQHGPSQAPDWGAMCPESGANRGTGRDKGAKDEVVGPSRRRRAGISQRATQETPRAWHRGLGGWSDKSGVVTNSRSGRTGSRARAAHQPGRAARRRCLRPKLAGHVRVRLWAPRAARRCMTRFAEVDIEGNRSDCGGWVQ